MVNHLVMELRKHRSHLHSDPVRHEYPAEGETEEATTAAAVAIAREKMRDNYADPVELQNEDRTVRLDKAALMAEVNK